MRNITKDTIREAIVIEHEAQAEVEAFLAESDWDYNDEITEAYAYIERERANREDF